MIPPSTPVRVSGRRLVLGEVIERPWTGRVLHSWDLGGGLTYSVQPDDGSPPIEVRAEHLRPLTPTSL